jgi:hypothetical protein
MNCSEARSGLLEADLATLEGRDGSPLGTHIAECSGCRARAQAILEGESLLASKLGQEIELPDLDGIISAAEAEESVESLPSRWRGWASRKRVAALLPMAAAAAMVALFLGRAPTLPGPEYILDPPGDGMAVEVPLGQSVAVMETNNPEITVLWLF